MTLHYIKTKRVDLLVRYHNNLKLNAPTNKVPTSADYRNEQKYKKIDKFAIKLTDLNTTLTVRKRYF